MKNTVFAVILITSLLLVGCGGSKYSLECDITTEAFSFTINGETGNIKAQSNGEKIQTFYDANGKVKTISATVNRDLTYESSGNVYHIEGTIGVDVLADKVTYSIKATSDAFGDSPQTCQSP